MLFFELLKIVIFRGMTNAGVISRAQILIHKLQEWQIRFK